MSLEDDLRQLFEEVDHDNNGKISPKEWKEALAKGHVTSYLHMHGFSRQDLQEYFRLHVVNSDDGMVDTEDFIRGFMYFSGGATNFQMAMMLEEVQKLPQRIRRDMARFTENLGKQGE